jgi:hypothetical protein
MVYKDSFVVVVKCNGQILRERDNVVILPFGSHYSLQLKNLESRRVNVKASIDGQDILSSSSLIMEPNSDFELLGFLEGLTVKNKFKFIQKTKEIQEHRGDRIDDGIVRVEFAFEKQIIKRSIIHDHHYYPPIIHHHHYPYWGTHWVRGERGLIGDDVGTTGSSMCYNASVDSIQKSNTMSFFSEPEADEGITVKGEETRQDFVYGSIGELEPSQVITIMLRGTKSNNVTTVSEPVTVKTKLTCPTCGRKSLSSSKFCSNCGTFLE